ncbi:hypothetical protein M8U27_06865 [Enterobacter hormaechei]|uniref:hypothetical protein n=1 Tax=Enterobacter hormaechei TaxID=158836 RepID=UPI002074E94E|nr:hypothetical protein [Enterobacter hormaechei]MCM8203966.1 hypothetical protein [Enterobacter hormaechei]MCM8233654.1 hypothetical protein [Enterobacter hormaechei]MDF3634548.1 hypothetical protein [Enterobacter hormaechei]
MSNIDKRSVQAVADLKAGYTLGHADVAILNELARIALASLEAEPVAYIIQDADARSRGEKGILRYFANISDEDINEYQITVTPLYTAPPAPVSVHAGYRLQPISEYDAMCAAMLQGAENAETPATMQTAPALDSSPKIAESPAGINQGKSEPVTTAYKLPFEQWLSQQTGTIDVECGCVMTEVFFHWLRVAYETGNSPVIPDGWKLVPVEPTAEMISSGIAAHYERSQIQIHDRPAPGPMECAYVSMLAAAPQQEVNNDQ